MSLIAFIIATFFSGLIIGALARLALPGPDPMSLFQTALVGIAGSWIAGALVALLTHGRYTAGLFASFVGAFAIVYFIRRRRGGSLRHPGNARRGLFS
jgi:uncharacterized membrane protein YeaQ/YmgE (transglycosylase-associated protein family)